MNYVSSIIENGLYFCEIIQISQKYSDILFNLSTFTQLILGHLLDFMSVDAGVYTRIFRNENAPLVSYFTFREQRKINFLMTSLAAQHPFTFTSPQRCISVRSGNLASGTNGPPETKSCEICLRSATIRIRVLSSYDETSIKRIFDDIATTMSGLI